jgi:hypothetical protein
MKGTLMGFGDLPLSPNIPELFTFSGLPSCWLLLEIAPLLEFKDQTQRMPNLNDNELALSSLLSADYIARLRPQPK